MTKKTHIAVGIAAILPLLSIYPKYAFIGIIGSTLPDIDLRLGIKHRTSTHSLIALLISTIVIMFCNFSIGLIFGLSFFMHLLLDSFTKMGVPFLYPFKKKYYGLKLIKTGESEDLFICLLAIFFICTEYLIK